MNALIIVDMQNDFLPGGSLGVNEGDQTVQPILAAARNADWTICSRDWHPVNHSSFREFGGTWPVHCVAETEGALLHPEIEKAADWIVNKGDGVKEAYSAFDRTGLDVALREEGVDEITVAGLATDYCVRATVLDGLDHGFRVTVLTDGCRAVDLEPGDGLRALEEMRDRGAAICLRGEPYFGTPPLPKHCLCA